MKKAETQKSKKSQSKPSADKSKGKSEKQSSGKSTVSSTGTMAKWSADGWDADTMIKAAEILLRKNDENVKLQKEKENWKLRQTRENLEQFKTDLAMLEKMRNELNLMANKGEPSPIDEADQKKQELIAKEESKMTEDVLDKIRKIDYSKTKKYKLSKGSIQIDKSGSAGSRLQKNNDPKNPWTAAFLKSQAVHLFVALANQNPLFYGTTEGQRIHVLAAHYLKKTHPTSVKADDLMNEVTKKLDTGVKEQWPEVSNFWLSGSADSKVGLAGERALGREQRGDKNGEPKSSKQEVSNEVIPDLLGYNLLKIYDDDIRLLKQIIDLRKGGSDNASEIRKLFISQFHVEQARLNKDWFQDINRPDYKDKPGHDAAKDQQENTVLRYEDLICRRMCKWMLHIAEYNDQPVIYALDEIDLPAVAESRTLEITDTVSGSGKKKIKVPVCTSELREIFRAQDKLESDHPLSGVKFFKELMPVDAPWGKGRSEEELKSWAEYALHLTRKMLIKFPGDVLVWKSANAMIAAYDKEKWGEIISLYKAIKPSQLHKLGVTNHDKHLKTSMERQQQSGLQSHSQMQKAYETAGILETYILQLNKSSGKKEEYKSDDNSKIDNNAS